MKDIPAFPQSKDWGEGYMKTDVMGGMTLRDYFAGQALCGLTAAITKKETTNADYATVCYSIADAMLKERKV